MKTDEDQDKVAPFGVATAAQARLPYAIELWDLPRVAPERVLGRAASAILGRAIFQAAQAEHPGRRIVLRRGRETIAQTD
jgi:hypothetical protein